MMGNTSLIIVVLLFAGARKIHGDDDIHGRLLTPKEGCGLTKVKNTRIVGGTEAPAGAYPWLAILGYYRGCSIAFECGGSLITSRHVLTAAHCIEDDLHVVRLGEHDLTGTDDGPHQDILVAKATKHPNAVNDVGIIHLEQDVEFSDKIRPVCLPIDEPYQSREFVDANAFVAGWGITTRDCFDFAHRSQALMQLQVPIVDNKKCKELLSRVGKATEAEDEIKEHVICAGGVGGKGFWIGDSGGPLVLPIHQNGTFPFYQIGVVSFSFGCARVNTPGIYSRVQYHAHWIKGQLQN